MGSHALAWVAAGLAVAVGLLALHRATRGLDWTKTRIVVGVLLAVCLLVPAPVPGYEGSLAPAFLVFTFESLFQQSGSPHTAGIILAASGIAALAVLLLIGVVVRGRRRA